MQDHHYVNFADDYKNDHSGSPSGTASMKVEMKQAWNFIVTTYCWGIHKTNCIHVMSPESLHTVEKLGLIEGD
jgi:hypothetical protein